MYVCKDCINWALLNPVTEEMRIRAKTVSDLQFTGDLSHEVGPYHEETEEGEVVSILHMHDIETGAWGQLSPKFSHLATGAPNLFLAHKVIQRTPFYSYRFTICMVTKVPPKKLFFAHKKLSFPLKRTVAGYMPRAWMCRFSCDIKP